MNYVFTHQNGFHRRATRPGPKQLRLEILRFVGFCLLLAGLVGIAAGLS